MSIDYDRLQELSDECTTGQWQSHEYEPDPYLYPGATRFVIAADWDKVETVSYTHLTLPTTPYV